MSQKTDPQKKAELELLKLRATEKMAAEMNVRDARAPNAEFPVPVQP